MTHKYEGQCWSCDSKDMERLPNHVRCHNCGATWNQVTQLGPEILERGLSGSNLFDNKRGWKKGRPSAAAQRQATRARDAKRQARTPK